MARLCAPPLPLLARKREDNDTRVLKLRRVYVLLRIRTAHVTHKSRYINRK